MFENPRRGRQARNFTTNAPKILDLKSSSEQIFFRKFPLGAPVFYLGRVHTYGYRDPSRAADKTAEPRPFQRTSGPLTEKLESSWSVRATIALLGRRN